MDARIHLGHTLQHAISVPLHPDLEAQTMRCQKESMSSQIEVGIAPGGAESYTPTPPIGGHPASDRTESPRSASGLDNETKLPIPQTDGTAHQPMDQSLSPELTRQVDAFKTRYYSGSHFSDDDEDILGSLYHFNICHIRAKLLEHYLFLGVNSKVYSDGVESLFPMNSTQPMTPWLASDIQLSKLEVSLESYIRAEKNYQEWMRLPAKEKERQNKHVYPSAVSESRARNIAIIVCAGAYNLAEEKEAFAAFKEEAERNRMAAIKKKIAESGILSEYKSYRQHSGYDRRKIDKLEEKNRFVSRASMAVFGGIAVIAPMLIMSLHPTRLTQLLTTSIFVILIALILAWLMDDAERKDVIAATAAYAAVLVVFVGGATTTT